MERNSIKTFTDRLTKCRVIEFAQKNSHGSQLGAANIAPIMQHCILICTNSVIVCYSPCLKSQIDNKYSKNGPHLIPLIS